MPEPEYKEIARRKQAQLQSKIPQGWRLPAQWIPAGILSVDESITNTRSYDQSDITDIPRQCGLLTARELEITEAWDAKGILIEIANGKLSCKDVCQAFCKRAAIAHQLTRCLTEPLFDDAMKRAEKLDDHFKRTGTTYGPLHGLPISVKDTFDIEGVDSTTGLAALGFKPAKQNAPLVDLLYSLGAVIVGKTNVPQTLGALDSVNNLFGRTLNPLNRKLTAGGSSGGEAVMVLLRGSMIGIGTDIGGSIRIPAMCEGLYGFKPSVGRVPYGGQESCSVPGHSRTSIQAVAGPLARSMDDINVLMKEIVPRSAFWGEDCIPGQWVSETPEKPSKLTVGILRSDGRIPPLPPIAKVLEEVAETLCNTNGIEVVEIPILPELGECQAVTNALMGVDGGQHMMDLLESASEELIPWLKSRVKRGTPKSIDELSKIQAKRSHIERQLMKMWTCPGTDKTRRVDAIIHPVAPHPVPEIDRYNAVGYTSSFVLVDYPAGNLPVRKFTEQDLEIGKEMDSKILSSWDKRNRELWNSSTVNRRVYLDSPLSIQVLTPRLHDYDLYYAMDTIDKALKNRKRVASQL
ncbi:acetamidase [Nannizzia gypsea CBS 118893]|uniref:Acetamidase n=1 Tax=Arthroderma gypseum (strain ATCC MYA-4604 / CBS 118893) TaxID=535722 RepID=E4V237_ARTGP|nr:acetamidase [Nannizzia gypsea CBS 118893]EFR04102.1 acetamidase [Nannizzia gypsea CBS 118893]